MKKDSFKVRCDSCGQTHSSVIETQEAFVDYEYDFERGEYEHLETRDAHSSEYYCPNCRSLFDSRTAEQIDSVING